jgi:asparagine synthase (glutamine-hydrolysing)
MSDWLGFFSTHSSCSQIPGYLSNTGFNPEQFSSTCLDKRLWVTSQPSISHCGNIFLYLAGKIYNHLEIRHGLRFSSWHSESQSETIVEGIAQRGLSLVLDLRGSFAFAAYDRSKCQLLLGRDRIGLQPLYISWQSDGLFFSCDQSKLSQFQEQTPFSFSNLLTYGHIPHSFSFPGPETKGVAAFPPAFVVRVNYSRPHDPIRYWPSQPRPDWTPLPLKSFSRASTFLRHQLEEVILLQLRSVSEPVCLLNTDPASLCLSALVNRLNSCSTQNVSVSLPGDFYDFPTRVQFFSKPGSTTHHNVNVSEDVAVSSLQQGLLSSDYLTLFNPSSYLQRCALSTLGISTFFSSSGASDLFGSTYLHHHIPLIRILQLFPVSLRRFVYRLCIGSLDTVDYDLSSYDSILSQVFASTESYNSPIIQSGLPHPHYPALDLQRITQLWGRISWAYLFGITEPLLLRNLSDSNITSNPVTLCPFLDSRIVELALRLPQSFHRPGQGLLLKSCEDLLSLNSNAIVSGRCSLPLTSWLLGPLRSICISRLSFLESTGWFDNSWLQSQWTSFESGHISSMSIWRLVLLGESIRRRRF